MPKRPSMLTSYTIRRHVERFDVNYRYPVLPSDPVRLELDNHNRNNAFGDALDMFDNFFNVPGRFRKEMREDFDELL